MIEVSINNNQYEIPNNWVEVNFEKFKSISSLKIGEDMVQYWIDVISILGNIPIDQIEALNNNDFNTLVNSLGFLNETLETKKIKNIKINGKKYNVKQYNQLTLGEHINFEMIIKQNKDDVINAYPYIVALLCQKENEKIDIGEITQRAKMIEDNVNIVDMYSIVSFFFQKELKSSKHLNQFLQKNMMKMKMMMKMEKMFEKSMKNGRGIVWRIGWLILILSRLMRFCKRTILRVSTIWPMNMNKNK